MPRPITDAERAATLKVAVVTLDGHLAGAAERAFASLKKESAGISASLHCAGEWASDPDSLERCRTAIGEADIVIACMLFMEEHINAVLPALTERRDRCDAMLCFMSAGEVMRLTRIGGFSMSGRQKGPLALLKKLRGAKAGNNRSGSSGAKQMALLRRLPRILRFIPGTAQDLRAYFLAMQYWLAGSEQNIRNLVAYLVARYADGPRRHFREQLTWEAPQEKPETALYHPRMKGEISERLADLPKAKKGSRGTVGLLLMRPYILAGNCRHYDAVIEVLEARGLRVIPAFASGLDARPAIERYFERDGVPQIDALVSLTGFSLIGGPAYNDAAAAQSELGRLDVPYIAAHCTEFQTLEGWEASPTGLLPVETTLMVAIPELDGATGPMLISGRSERADADLAREMQPQPERVSTLAARVAKLVALRRAERAERRIGIVLFNFPPNGGATGTAAHLSVFRSLFNTLAAMRDAGYDVELPADVDALRESIVKGNAERYGSGANVHARIGADDHVRRETWLDDIEREWGPAPGRVQSDGSSIHVYGERFGNVFVGVQPAFGYEGDPMRLLFERGFAPTHAFSAFYRWLREDFAAHAVLHFGTHGALEFMPGKQTGLSSACWPERLIGDLPNYYLYAANNPSEGTLAKRRAAATLVSYLTPTVTKAGLYRGLVDLQSSLDRWRATDPALAGERAELATLVQAQAAELELCEAEPAWTDTEDAIARLVVALAELRDALIPHGLHTVGEAAPPGARRDWLGAVAEARGVTLPETVLDELVSGGRPRGDGVTDALAEELVTLNRHLSEDSELPALIHALDGRFVPPVHGGDLLRSTDVLPTGRNLHGFDPFRLPSAWAMQAGSAQADELLERYVGDSGALPESVAIVLWGTDNIKTEGGPIAQVLRLLGAQPRFDTYGRLAGAELVPLEALGRPRIDVVVTLSGIFRDLLPPQTRLLAEAAWLAAAADEPLEMNFVRKHALAYQAAHGCDLETAALRVYSNAEGAYGSNVNHLVDAGAWDDDDELAEQYSRRKCFAYGVSGAPQRQSALLASSLADVNFAYQNLESAELGITSIDHYFDTLGGINRAVRRARGHEVEVYIGDQTGHRNTIRTLSEQVALETRSRVLNPRWYEGMLEHGYEGVRQIESHVTNTMGWSATTGRVSPWVYQKISETFLLDDEMRRRLAELNPDASAKVAHRLLEAHERQYWSPDPDTLAALERAGEELEDRLEGITGAYAA